MKINAEIAFVKLIFTDIVQVPVIHSRNAVLIQHVKHLVVYEISENHRVMNKTYGFRFRVGTFKLLSFFKRQLQHCGFTLYNTFVLGLNSKLAHPASGTANYFVFDDVRVIVKKRYLSLIHI